MDVMVIGRKPGEPTKINPQKILNNKERYTGLFDTGASISGISEEIADTWGIPP